MDQALHSLRAQLRPRSCHPSTHDGSANYAESDEGNSDDELKRDDTDGAKPQTDGDGMRVRREHSSSSKRGVSSRRRIHFEVSELQELYHLPLKLREREEALRVFRFCSALCPQAAEQLGICEAALKRICRRNHIKKWPYRHLQSIRRRMAHLEGQENAAPLNAQCQEERSQDLSMKGKATRRRSESVCGRPRAAFLLPHEKKRAQPEHREQSSSKDDVTKRTMLRILEEEQERVINQAHRAGETDIPEQVSAQQTTEVPGQRLNAMISFVDLLAWSVPQHDTIHSTPPYDVMHSHKANPANIIREESALLLLANVCCAQKRLPDRWVPRPRPGGEYPPLCHEASMISARHQPFNE